jgi:hypothetical protein
MKNILSALVLVLIGISFTTGCSNVSRAMHLDKSVELFDGTDTNGWNAVQQEHAGSWKVVGHVALDPSDNKKLLAEGKKGVLLRSADVDHGCDIYSDKQFGDCKVHAEFMIPKGSNSGLYLMGRYEVQIFDSFGKPDDQLKATDCGAIYNVAAPTTNAEKSPGEWQSYDIIFRAPRFDAAGNKTENARFVNVTLNKTQIQKDVEVKGPTGGQIDKQEKPTGPIMLQGNHGIVAFRTIRVTPMEVK